jgi:hypothetical protein
MSGFDEKKKNTTRNAFRQIGSQRGKKNAPCAPKKPLKTSYKAEFTGSAQSVKRRCKIADAIYNKAK